MIGNVILPVVYEPQSVFYTCGPACINMVLSRWGKNYDQGAVWNAVQANTFTAGPRPPDAPKDAGSFDNQLCELCGSQTMPDGTVVNTYEVWYTSPGAMAETIAASSPPRVMVNYIADFGDTIRRMADSIATWDTPAVYTTPPALHWVVAYGYQYHDAPPAAPLSSIQWNAQYITGIFTLNPSSAPAGNDLTMVTPRGLPGLLMSIGCGEHKDKHPVVGGAANLPWFWVVATTFIRVVKDWLDPRRYRRYTKKPPGPPVPPPPNSSFYWADEGGTIPLIRM